MQIPPLRTPHRSRNFSEIRRTIWSRVYKSAIARAAQDNASEVDCLSDLNVFLTVSLWSRGTIHHRIDTIGYKRVFETTCWFSFFLRDFFGQRLTHFYNGVVPLKIWILIPCLGRIFISVTSKGLDRG